MRYGPTDTFHVVVDPTPDSELGDVCFETTLQSLERQFRGGLKIAENPTIFTDKAEAEAEARTRMVALRVATAIKESAPHQRMQDIGRVALYDREGNLVFETELP